MIGAQLNGKASDFDSEDCGSIPRAPATHRGYIMSDLKYRIISKDYVVIDRSGVNLGLTLKQLRELQKLIPEMMIKMLTINNMEKSE